MVADTQQTPDGRNSENPDGGRCDVCAKKLRDDEALIVADYDPVVFLEGRGVLKGYEIRCEDCIALLPECPVCEGLMNECPTCAAHYYTADMRWRSATAPTTRPCLLQRLPQLHCAISAQRYKPR